VNVVSAPFPLLDTEPPDPLADIELEPPMNPPLLPCENKSPGANSVTTPKAIIRKKRLVSSSSLN
jgi:hypothetical protein